MFLQPAEVVTKIWLRKGLGAIGKSWVSDENQRSRSSSGMLPPEVKGATSIWTSCTPQVRKLPWFGHVTRQETLSKTILQEHLRGGTTLWSAKEVLDGQHQRVDISVHARTVHRSQGSPAEKNRRRYLLFPSCSPDDPTGQRTEVNWADSRKFSQRA